MAYISGRQNRVAAYWGGSRGLDLRGLHALAPLDQQQRDAARALAPRAHLRTHPPEPKPIPCGIRREGGQSLVRLEGGEGSPL